LGSYDSVREITKASTERGEGQEIGPRDKKLARKEDSKEKSTSKKR